MIKEWITLLTLRIAHHEAIYVGNRNMDAGLE